MQQACAYYRRWGAEGKVKELTRRRPDLAARAGVAGPGEQPSGAALSTSSPLAVAELPATSPDQLDLLAVIKASQTISGAMGREELVRTLLQIVIEQGGARRARLIRVRDGELEIAAEIDIALAPDPDPGQGQGKASAESAEPGALVPRIAGPRARVPSSMLHYVARTQTRVVLDDADVDAGRFTADAYLAATRPRSVLCLPILREGRVVALLYLENDLAPGVFTPERLAALELIAAQVAISLENSLLLEREHKARLGAEAAGRRALILGEATALVSSTFDYKGVFGGLARLCVREPTEHALV
ncbi:MAG TPA: GAF domain-containing protein, partial [Planctomycetota bacterium]|nr:GAF domain-containing protein [Planctomycetota bacterium]